MGNRQGGQKQKKAKTKESEKGDKKSFSEKLKKVKKKSDRDGRDIDAEESSHMTAGDSESCVFHSAENVSVSPYLDSCTRSELEHDVAMPRHGENYTSVSQHSQILCARDFRDGFSLEACIPTEIARPEESDNMSSSLASMEPRGSSFISRTSNSSLRSGRGRNVPSPRLKNSEDVSSMETSSELSRSGVGGYSTPLLSTPVLVRTERRQSPSSPVSQLSGNYGTDVDTGVRDYNRSRKPERRPLLLTSSSVPFRSNSSEDSSSSAATPVSNKRAGNFLALFRSGSKNGSAKKHSNEQEKDASSPEDPSRNKSSPKEKGEKSKFRPLWKTWERSSSKKKTGSQSKISIFGTTRKTRKKSEDSKTFQESVEEVRRDVHEANMSEVFENPMPSTGGKMMHTELDGERNIGFIDDETPSTWNNSQNTPAAETKSENRPCTPPVKPAALCIMKLEELERAIEKTIREKFPDAEAFLSKSSSNEENLRVSRSLPATPSLKKKCYIARDTDDKRKVNDTDRALAGFKSSSTKTSDQRDASMCYYNETYENPPNPAISPIILRRFGSRTRHSSISPKIQRAKTAALYSSPSEMSKAESLALKTATKTSADNLPTNDSQILFEKPLTAHKKSVSKYDNVMDESDVLYTGATSGPQERLGGEDDSDEVEESVIYKESRSDNQNPVIVPTFSAVFGSVSPKLKRHLQSHFDRMERPNDEKGNTSVPFTTKTKKDDVQKSTKHSPYSKNSNGKFANEAKDTCEFSSQNTGKISGPQTQSIGQQVKKWINEPESRLEKSEKQTPVSDTISSTGIVPALEKEIMRSVQRSRPEAADSGCVSAPVKSTEKKYITSLNIRATGKLARDETEGKSTSYEEKETKSRIVSNFNAQRNARDEEKVSTPGKVTSPGSARKHSTEHVVFGSAVALPCRVYATSHAQIPSSPGADLSAGVNKSHTAHAHSTLIGQSQRARNVKEQELNRCENDTEDSYEQKCPAMDSNISDSGTNSTVLTSLSFTPDTHSKHSESVLAKSDGGGLQVRVDKRAERSQKETDSPVITLVNKQQSCEDNNTVGRSTLTALPLETSVRDKERVADSSSKQPSSQTMSELPNVHDEENQKQKQQQQEQQEQQKQQRQQKRRRRRQQQEQQQKRHDLQEIPQELSPENSISTSQPTSPKDIAPPSKQQQQQQQKQHRDLQQIPQVSSAETNNNIRTIQPTSSKDTAPPSTHSCEVSNERTVAVVCKSSTVVPASLDKNLQGIQYDGNQAGSDLGTFTEKGFQETDSSIDKDQSLKGEMKQSDKSSTNDTKPSSPSTRALDEGKVGYEMSNFSSIETTKSKIANESFNLSCGESSLPDLEYSESARSTEKTSDVPPPPSPTIMEQAIVEEEEEMSGYEDDVECWGANKDVGRVRDADMKEFTEKIYNRLSDLLNKQSEDDDDEEMNDDVFENDTIVVEESWQRKDVTFQQGSSDGSLDRSPDRFSPYYGDDMASSYVSCPPALSPNQSKILAVLESSSSLTTTTESESEDFEEPPLFFQHEQNVSGVKSSRRAKAGQGVFPSKDVWADTDSPRNRRSSREYHSDDDIATGRGIPDYYDDRPLWSRRQKTPGQMSQLMMVMRRRERRERWLKKRRRNRTDLLSAGSSDNCSEQQQPLQLHPRIRDSSNDEGDDICRNRDNSKTNEMGSGILTSPKYMKPIMPFLNFGNTNEAEKPDNDSRQEKNSERLGYRGEQDKVRYRHRKHERREKHVEHFSGEDKDHLSAEHDSDEQSANTEYTSERQSSDLCLGIPGIEETFHELLSVQSILDGMQEKAGHTEEQHAARFMPLTKENVKVVRESYKTCEMSSMGRRSRMSATDRTESDLDIYSEVRDDASSDSNVYADDEEDDDGFEPYATADDDNDATGGSGCSGGQEGVRHKPAGRDDNGNDPEANFVVSCTFYNSNSYPANPANPASDENVEAGRSQTQTTPTEEKTCLNSDEEFWAGSAAIEESYRQLETAADAVSSTFQNAREQMHDIQHHLQALRRQMEILQDDLSCTSMTLTPDMSVESAGK